MKRLLVTVSFMLFASTASAEQTLAEYSWPQRDRSGAARSGQVLQPNETAAFVHLKLDSDADRSRTFTVMIIDEAAVTAERYALTGRVKYDNVQGIGYLEMWSHFPDGSKYFTRTLDTAGPLANLSGSSDWRSFTLPFSIGNETTMRPAALTVNVVLPAGGTVYLSPLNLVQYPAPQPVPAAASPKAWWDGRTVGKIGGIWGIGMGLLSGLIGTLGGLGRARRLCLALLATMFGIGVLALILAVVAIIRAQPMLVLYPLLLAGILDTILPGALYYPLAKRYEEIELRKMEALDVR